MTDTPDRPKVVDMFGRKPINETAAMAESARVADVPGPKRTFDPTGVDMKSIQTLNSVVEAVLSKECTGVCVFAMSTSGMPRFWMSFPEGSKPQIEALRYLGTMRMFEGILEQTVYDGVEVGQ